MQTDKFSEEKPIPSKEGSYANSSMTHLQNLMDDAFHDISKKRLSYEEWCIKKDTEKKLKNKLVNDTKMELHNELAQTLEEALQRKRKGDFVVSEWIKNKKKEYRKQRQEKHKQKQYK